MQGIRNIKPVYLHIIGGVLIGIAITLDDKQHFSYYILLGFGVLFTFVAILTYFKK